MLCKMQFKYCVMYLWLLTIFCGSKLCYFFPNILRMVLWSWNSYEYSRCLSCHPTLCMDSIFLITALTCLQREFPVHNNCLQQFLSTIVVHISLTRRLNSYYTGGIVTHWQRVFDFFSVNEKINRKLRFYR